MPEQSATPGNKRSRPVRVGTAIPPAAENFDRLPDSALVPVTVLALVMGMGVSTAWAKSKTDPEFPKLRRYGPKNTKTTVGEIRRAIQKKALAKT